MASIENMVLDIQEKYNELMGYIGKIIMYHDKGDDINKENLKYILRLTLRYQRFLEYILDKIKGIDKTSSSERLNIIFGRIIDRFVSNETFEKISFYPYEFEVKGAIVNLRKSLHLSDRLDYHKGKYRYLCCAYTSLRDMESDLIEFQEELRYISLLNSFSIETTIQLKQTLLNNEFNEVVFSLEEAESNIEIEHWKDVISRCRDALEMFICSIYKKELRKEPTKYFSKDLQEIIKEGILDEPIQRIILGIFGFLSLKGSHKYDESK